MSSFINFNNRGSVLENKYSAEVIKTALLKSETKSSAKAESLTKNIKEPVSLSEALVFFTDKLGAIKQLNQSIVEVNEGRVKQFEMDYTSMVKDIKRGYGWIDPEYVADTWENSSDSIGFDLVRDEIFDRLIAAGLLAHADSNDPEKAGKYIKSAKDLYVMESEVEEISEGRYYAFHKGQKHEIEADSLWGAKQKAITDLKVKKKDVGMLAIVLADSHDDFSKGKNSEFAFEGKTTVYESATAQLADEEKFELYTATLKNKTATITATTTTKTWDDGVPVLKYLAKGKGKPIQVNINGSFEVAHDVARGWFYFTDGRKWFGLHVKDGYGDSADLPFNMEVKESVNEGAFVVYIDGPKGKELLGTFHNKKAAEKYKSEEEDETLNTKGVDSIGTMSKDMWDKKEAPYITEAKFVKDFNRDVLNAKTKEEVLELYPNAEFFIGKSDHFFGELDSNLFFKAYYTKAQKEFEIKSVYSEKGSNYVHLYNESVVTEAKGFKNTTDFEKFLIEIDGMGESQIKKIMGKDYIDTPGYYQDEKGDYDDAEDFMRSNMGTKEFEKLESWWESNVAESVVNEAEYKVGDTITVTLKGGKEVVKGKVEKLNPLKVRTGPTDVQVLGNHLIKNVVKESVVTEGISVTDERFYGKKGIIIMIDDNGKQVSAIFKDKKNADKYNRNKAEDIKALLDLAKDTKYPNAIDESVVNEAVSPEVHRSVNKFISKMADKYDITLQDAVYNIITVLKSQNYQGLSESVVTEGKEADEAEAILNDLLDERGGDFDELRGMSMEDALDTVEAYGHKGSKAKKIAQELVSMTNESVVTEGRSVNKIQKEWNQVTTDMIQKVAAWKAAEGDRKAEILEELKALTVKKKALESELDMAVAGKDKDVQLVVSEGNAFGAARAEAIAKGEKTFKVDGEEYDVESVDKEDKENAEEFVSERNAFLAARAKAIQEESDEFEFNGKTYPVIYEGNAFGAARAEAIANGTSTFTVDGEEYDVEDVDAEDKKNAEEFVEESEILWDALIEKFTITNEDLRSDIKKYIKTNKKEIDALADQDDWDRIYSMLMTDFEVEEDDKAADEIKTIFNIVY